MSTVEIERAPADEGRIKRIEVPCAHTHGDGLELKSLSPAGDFVLTVIDSHEEEEKQESSMCMSKQDLRELWVAIGEMLRGY